MIDTPMLADATLIALAFITSLILFSLLTANISERVLDSRVGAVDRTLGFVYGLVRGLILVVIAFLIVSQIVDRPNLPKWVREARSLPLIESTGDTIKSLLPDNPESLFKRDRPASPAPEAERG
ncbi:colicin V synthesis protein [Rhodomicrobium udaipurense JA643]|nr:colicin V synthesis protein [Rhodomicrobium udaipurense JA643]